MNATEQHPAWCDWQHVQGMGVHARDIVTVALAAGVELSVSLYQRDGGAVEVRLLYQDVRNTDVMPLTVDSARKLADGLHAACAQARSGAVPQ